LQGFPRRCFFVFHGLPHTLGIAAVNVFEFLVIDLFWQTFKD
jgi:hypothetical protein